MGTRTRRRFTAEFKAQAVARLSEPGATTSGVAAELGLSPTQLKTWRLELEAAGSGEAIARATGRGGRAAAAPPRCEAAEGGERDPPQGLGFFRAVGGESMKAKLAFISAQASAHAVRRLCAVLKVARSWVHAWRRAAPVWAERAAHEAALVEEIRTVFERSRRRYGAPRIHAELQGAGWRISRKRVARLMKENAMSPPRPPRKAPITTDSRHRLGIAPNLLARNFDVVTPDTVWLADISYIPTDEGWLYLAAVKDLATREIVGWSMDVSLRSRLCENALTMAIRNRRPPRGLIQHSDRGAQYAWGDYRKILAVHGIKASMSGKGNCLDCESVWAA